MALNVGRATALEIGAGKFGYGLDSNSGSDVPFQDRFWNDSRSYSRLVEVVWLHGLVHQIREFIGFHWPSGPVPDVKNSNGFRLLVNGEVHLVAALAFSVQKKTDFRFQVGRLWSDGASGRHFRETTNCREDSVEPPLGSIRTGIFSDVGGDAI